MKFALAVLPVVAILTAQVAPEPAFDVASVRVSASGDGRVLMDASGGRYTVKNANARLLIRNAYGLQEAQLVGGPGWLDTVRFDIAAGRGGAPADQIPAMMRALLADRFKLRAHYETREMPMFALVTARNDRRLGAQLVPVSCGGRPLLPEPGQKLPCNTRFVGPGRLRAGGLSIRELATLLTTLVGRIVIDKSGVSGNYDFDLTWAPEQARTDASRDDFLPPVDRDAPPIFTALQEQLGLKLDGGRGAVDVLVIDRIEQPGAN